MGGMRPVMVMGGLRWPWCSAGSGCSTLCRGIGGAVAVVGVGGLGCLCIFGGVVAEVILSWFK